MKVLILLLLCCLTAVVISLPTKRLDVKTAQKLHHRFLEGPEDPINRQIFICLNEHKKDVEGVIQKSAHLTQETKKELINLLHHSAVADAECNGCVVSIT